MRLLRPLLLFTLLLSSHACTGGTAGEGLSVAQAHAWQQAKEALVVDVRTQAEWRAGKLPAAIHMPLGDLDERLAASSLAKDQAILLHCQAGLRAEKALQYFRAQGFENLRYVQDGGYPQMKEYSWRVN